MASPTNAHIRSRVTTILRSLILSLALVLASCANPALASQDATFSVKLFGCQLPIPTSYALNARELNRVVLSRDSGEIGRIVISEFAGYSDMYEVSGETSAGHLTIAELTNHREWQTPDYDMTIIRDDEYIMALMGAARKLKTSIVDACLSPDSDPPISPSVGEE